jgi:hypothetical protein
MPQTETIILPFDNGLCVEVTADRDAIVELSSKDLPSKLGEGLSGLRKAIREISAEAAGAISDIKDLLEITQLEIEVGLGVQAEGNFYVVKGTGSANFKVKFTVKVESAAHGQNSK